MQHVLNVSGMTLSGQHDGRHYRLKADEVGPVPDELAVAWTEAGYVEDASADDVAAAPEPSPVLPKTEPYASGEVRDGGVDTEQVQQTGQALPIGQTAQTREIEQTPQLGETRQAEQIEQARQIEETDEIEQTEQTEEATVGDQPEQRTATRRGRRATRTAPRDAAAAAPGTDPTSAEDRSSDGTPTTSGSSSSE